MSKSISASLLLFICLIFLFSSLGFVIGLPISRVYFYLSLFLACLFLYRFEGKNTIAFLYFALIVLCAFGISISIYDSSVDGRWYHQIAIIYLKNGWNPIYEPISSLRELQEFLSAEIWIENYSKFFEIVGANFYLVTGKIESSKALNIILAIASMCYAYHALSFYNRKLALGFSFLLAFSPVVMAQIFTNYIDGTLSSLMLFAICAILALETQKTKFHLLILCASLLMLSSTKLTGIAYSGVIGIVYCIYLFFYDKRKMKVILSCGILVCVLVCLCNLNPYFTNLQKGRHLFYPLFGENKVDIISSHMAEEFSQKDRITQFFISTFSKTQNIPIGSLKDSEPQLKLPFTFAQDEQHLNVPDMRIGGFGFLFGGLWVIALVCLFASDCKERRMIILLSLLIGLSALSNPALWWARYVPQIWFLPLFWMFFAYRGVFKILVLCGMCVALINLGDAFVFSAGRGLFYTLNTNSILANLPNKQIKIYFPKESPNKSFMAKLMERKIDFVNVDEQEAVGFEEIPTNSLSYWNLNNDDLSFCAFDKNQIRGLGLSKSIQVFSKCFIQN